MARSIRSVVTFERLRFWLRVRTPNGPWRTVAVSAVTSLTDSRVELARAYLLGRPRFEQELTGATEGELWMIAHDGVNVRQMAFSFRSVESLPFELNANGGQGLAMERAVLHDVRYSTPAELLLADAPEELRRSRQLGVLDPDA